MCGLLFCCGRLKCWLLSPERSYICRNEALCRDSPPKLVPSPQELCCRAFLLISKHQIQQGEQYWNLKSEERCFNPWSGGQTGITDLDSRTAKRFSKALGSVNPSPGLANSVARWLGNLTTIKLYTKVNFIIKQAYGHGSIYKTGCVGNFTIKLGAWNAGLQNWKSNLSIIQLDIWVIWLLQSLK